jgi:hypothetical protein
MAQVENGFMCRICGRVVVSRKSLRIHIRDLHMPTVQFTCPVCKKVFTTRNSFGVHVSRKHRELKGLDFDLCATKKDPLQQQQDEDLVDIS